jgi:hypothetical protein
MMRRGHSRGNAAKWSTPSQVGTVRGSVGTTQTLPFSIGGRPVSHTQATLALSVAPDVGIPLIVDVSGWAVVAPVRFVSPSEVFLDGDGFKVLRIDASLVAAEMVDGESDGDGPDGDFIDEPGRASLADSGDVLGGIAVGIMVASEGPAVRSLPHLGQKCIGPDKT